MLKKVITYPLYFLVGILGWLVVGDIERSKKNPNLSQRIGALERENVELKERIRKLEESETHC